MNAVSSSIDQLSSNQLRNARLAVLLLALLLGMASLYYFYQIGAINLYGDGIAHLNIARKMVDLDSASIWTRYVQLGSPWLPLPHLLMLPLVWHDKLWRSGLAGGIVSMLCYVCTVLLIFEIGASFGALRRGLETGRKDILSGLLAATIFALNPSVLYMQATPMTELPFLATYAYAVWMLLRWLENGRVNRLAWAGVAAMLATLTRYEAWAIMPVGVLIIFLLASGGLLHRLRMALLWSAIAVTGPLYWLWHNWAIYNNPLEFYNGFYSPRNYLARFQEKLSWADFAMGNIGYATLLGFAAVIVCAGIVPCLLALGAVVRGLIDYRREWRLRMPEIRCAILMLLLAAPF
ncbi:MAG: hypothetical protein AB1489_20935, partial [Acidobacteriota bacterium]